MSNLSYKTINNLFYSVFGFLWPLVLTFFTLPILIHALGTEKYGYYILVNVGIAFFSLLDIGFSYRFIKKLSEIVTISAENELKINTLFSTTFWAYAFLGSMIFVLLLVLPTLYRPILDVPSGYIENKQFFILCLSLNFFVKMLTNLVSQIPYAVQRSDVTVKIAVVSSTLVQILSIIAVISGMGITGLVVVQLFSSILVFVAYISMSRKILPNLRLLRIFSFSDFKKILKDGVWVFIANGTGNILSQLDKFVVGLFCGTSGVTYYSSAQMVPEKINSTAFSLSLVLFPVFSQVSATRDIITARAIFRRGLSLIAFISAGLAMLVLIYNYQIYYYWLGKEIADNSYVAVNFLAVTYLLIAFTGFCDLFLNGWGKIKSTALISGSMAFLNVVFMFILIPRFNVAGAAMAYFVSVLPAVFIVLFIEKKYFKSVTMEVFKYYFSLALRLLLVVLTVSAASLLFKPLITNLLLVMIFGCISIVMYFSLYWFGGFFNEEDITLFKNFFIQKFHRVIN
ncbi:MAG: oligosaccharide flippase family protein [Candidatus Falkowbacteria bacterium]